MKNRNISMAIVVLLAAGTLLAGADRVETRTLERTVPVGGSGAGTLLVVDNVFGSIRVRGDSGGAIRMTAVETIEARSDAALRRARDEVELQVTEDGDEIVFYVDGPFRHRGHGRRHRNPGYEVQYEIELSVPRDLDLHLATVNGGTIHVEDVDGDFKVTNVNGSIEMNGISGSGDAQTVNGPVTVDFAAVPREGCDFQTINGELEITFPRQLSADLEFKTFNGEIWTDFDVQPLAAEPVRESVHGDLRVFRAGEHSSVRIASGGPRHSFETLNGDILIRSAR